MKQEANQTNDHQPNVVTFTMFTTETLYILLSSFSFSLLLLLLQVVLKHFYMRKQEVLQQCERWTRSMIEGMQRLRAIGVSVTSIAESFKTLLRLIESLRTELYKIKPADFEPSSTDEVEPS